MGILEREARFYLASRKALVYDDKRGTRQVMRDALLSCGVKSPNVFVEKTYSNARHIIETQQPEIIISEFEVHGQYGLDLARLQMDILNDHSNKIFIICTAGATQASVADAAEEEVEAFIVKPVNEETAIKYIQSTAKKKVNPTAYSSMVYEAKRLLREGNEELASQTLSMSKLMHDRPMMACYMLGEIHRKNGQLTEAMQQYETGLGWNPDHFRCLAGKFFALVDKKDDQEAFKVLEHLCEKFPLTPELLKQAFILSITSYHFEEVDSYYEQYIRQPRKTDDLKLTVSHALMTAGKMLLRERKHLKKAMDYFKKGAIISGRKSEYLNDLIDNMIREGYASETDNFFTLFTPEEMDSKLIKQFRFRAFAKTMHRHPDEIVKRGTELIYDGFADKECFTITCDLAKKLGRRQLLNTLAYKGIEAFPSEKEKFETYLKAA